jgi:hypothetical protein
MPFLILSAASVGFVILSAASAGFVILSAASVSERSRRIACGILFAILVFNGVAFGSTIDVSQLDADARAAGNMKALAVSIGDRIFSTVWPAQVTQVSANGVAGHVVVGVRISGVKFHASLTRVQFVSEVDRLVSLAFAAAPDAEEVDVWATVPVATSKGAVVAGDLAVPTSREVFTLAVRRGVDPSRTLAYWDKDWARSAFKHQS